MHILVRNLKYISIPDVKTFNVETWPCGVWHKGSVARRSRLSKATLSLIGNSLIGRLSARRAGGALLPR